MWVGIGKVGQQMKALKDKGIRVTVSDKQGRWWRNWFEFQHVPTLLLFFWSCEWVLVMLRYRSSGGVRWGEWMVKGKVWRLKKQRQHESTGLGLRIGAYGCVGVGNVSRLASLHYNQPPISHCHWPQCSDSLPMDPFHDDCQYTILSLSFSLVLFVTWHLVKRKTKQNTPWYWLFWVLVCYCCDTVVWACLGLMAWSNLVLSRVLFVSSYSQYACSLSMLVSNYLVRILNAMVEYNHMLKSIVLLCLLEWHFWIAAEMKFVISCPTLNSLICF